MAVKNPEIEKRKLEFKKIKAEIDKVAQVQKLLVVVIRFSVTVLMVLLMFVFFMAVNYAMPISAKVSQYMLYGLLGYFVVSLLTYVIKPLFEKADDEALALMIEKRYPQLLDRFICSVEMNKEEAIANFSPELIKALWVDTDKVKKALKLDLRKALAFTKGKQYIVIALVITIVAFVGSIVAPEFLLKSTSGIAPVNKFVNSLLRGSTLDPDMLKQSKALDAQLKEKEKMIEEVKNVLQDQKQFNKDLKDAIQERKAKDQERAIELAAKDPELAAKPWLPGRDPQFKNPNTGAVSGICTSNGKPISGIFVAVKSTTDKKAPAFGAKTDKDGKWVVENLSTDGSYQAWVLNSKYKSEPLSYFSGVVVEKGRTREGYNFVLKKKTMVDAPEESGGPSNQRPEDIFKDSDTYVDPTQVKKGSGIESTEEKLFPKMDFDDEAKKEETEKKAKENKIILPEEKKEQEKKEQDQKEQKPPTQEKKLEEMAKEMEKQDEKKEEKKEQTAEEKQKQEEKQQEKKDVAEKLKELSQKMEEMKKDENKKDEKQKEQERKDMQKQMEEQAKKLEEMNKDEKDQKEKEMKEEMAKELKKMSEEMKEEDKLKKDQEELEKKTDEMAKKDEMEKEKDAKKDQEKAKEKQEEAQDELQKSEMEKALEKSLEAEKKLEESLQKLLEEQQKMAEKQKQEDEQAKKDEEKKDEEKTDEKKDEKKDEKSDEEKKDEEKMDELKKEMEEEAKKEEMDAKKLEEMMKEMEEALKKMEELDKKKAEELKKEMEEVKKDLEEEKKEEKKEDKDNPEKKDQEKKRKREIGKKLETIAGLFGELKNRAFLAAKREKFDEDPVATMSRDDVPSKYKKMVDKYRTSLSK